MGALWTPARNGDGPNLNIIVPGREVRHVCHICEAEFYDTGDKHADDARFLRHFEACWRKEGEDEAGEHIEVRDSEPAFQGDDEYDDFMREKAEREKNPFVKGTSAWDPRTAIGKRRKK